MKHFKQAKKQLNQKKIKKKEIRNITTEILEIIFSGRECKENYYSCCCEIICEELEKGKIICYKENLCNILFLLIFLSGKAEIIRNAT